MANIIKIFKRLFEHRRYQRFPALSNTFVIVSPAITQERERKVQIVDISQGGVAFIYRGSSMELERSGFLKMFASAPYSGKIKFETVSNIQVSEASQTEEPCWRRGAKFTWMGAMGQSELKEFLKEFSLSEK
jgi:c-di-GMP-binding flagellar brake protein YcgR